MGAGDSPVAQRRQIEIEIGKRSQTHRIRTDALRDDDGRHSIAEVQVAHGHGRRTDSATSQKGCSRRHLGIHPVAAATSKGTPSVDSFCHLTSGGS